MTQFGGDDLVKAFRRIVVASVDKGAERGLFLGGQLIKQKTIPRTPLDHGKLRLSIYTSLHKFKHRNKTVVEIGSMGAVDRSNGFKYAIIQHETKEFHHSRGGEWKYLEKTTYEQSKRVTGFVISNIKRELKKLASK